MIDRGDCLVHGRHRRYGGKVRSREQKHVDAESARFLDGIRIDYALLSPQATDRFRGIETHRDARDMEKPSDHVPVVIDLDLEA